MPIPTRQKLFSLLDGGHDLYTIADILEYPVSLLASIIVEPVRELDLDEQIFRYLNSSLGYEFDLDFTSQRLPMGSMEPYDVKTLPDPTIKPRATHGGSYFSREDVASMIKHVLDSPVLDTMQLDGYDLNDREISGYIRVIAANAAALAEEKELQRERTPQKQWEDHMLRTGRGPFDE